MKFVNFTFGLLLTQGKRKIDILLLLIDLYFSFVSIIEFVLLIRIYISDMPYTQREADDALELYYRGPKPELKRYDPGMTTTTPSSGVGHWMEGRQFIYSGRVGIHADFAIAGRIWVSLFNAINFHFGCYLVTIPTL